MKVFLVLMPTYSSNNSVVVLRPQSAMSGQRQAIWTIEMATKVNSQPFRISRTAAVIIVNSLFVIQKLTQSTSFWL